MLICHFSDWYGRRLELPWADIYVCTGNILPELKIRNGDGVYVQDKWRGTNIHTKLAVNRFSLRNYFKNKQAPAIVCRGDKDLTNTFCMFNGGKVIELGKETRNFELLGLTFSGFRGVKRSLWPHDIVTENVAHKLADGISRNVDILVTHSPSFDLKDLSAKKEHTGLYALRSYINKQEEEQHGRLGLHLFGHAANSFGVRRLNNVDSDIFLCNAYGGWVLLEGKAEKVGKKLGQYVWTSKELRTIPASEQ